MAFEFVSKLELKLNTKGGHKRRVASSYKTFVKQ